MNKHENQVVKAELATERKELMRLQGIYDKAAEDISKNIKIHQGKIDVLLANIDNLDETQRSILQSQIYQRDFQKSLKSQIDAFTKDLNASQYASIEDYMKECYQNGYIGNMYSLHKQGIPVITPIDQKKVVEAMRTVSPISENLYKHLGVDVEFLKKRIANNLSRGIASGMTYNQIASEIARDSRVGFNRAARIARTEGHGVQCRARFDGMLDAREQGADQVKQWDATLDGHTRESHREVDGELRELEEPFSNGMMMPSDSAGGAEEVINCRCTLLTRARWALDEEELQRLKDRADYYDLDKTENFDAFKRKYLKAVETETKCLENTVKKVNEFIPAKSIEEAEGYAQQYIGDGYSPTFKNQAIYKGISLDHANEINNALHSIYSNVEMPKLNGIKVISPTSAKGKKIFSSADAVAAYSPVEHGIFINKDVLKDAKAIVAYNKKSDEAWKLVMQNIDNLTGTQKELALTYKNAGRALVGNGSVKDYLTHEMGHHVEWAVLDAKTNNLVGRNMGKYAPKISGYANASKGEYLAESFVAYMKGEVDLIDPEYVEFLKKKAVKTVANSEKKNIIKVTQKKAYTKISVDDIAPMESSRFNRIKEGLAKNGVDIIQDAEGDAYLNFMGAEAMTLSNGSAVIFQSGRIPSASACFEEIIHTTQIKKYGMIKKTGDTVSHIEHLSREIEANEKLLRHQKAYGFTKEDTESIEINLAKYYTELKEVEKYV